MRSDDDIYNDIGGILCEIAPGGACKVIMRAQLSQELDSCEYEYDYIDERGNVAWFTAGGVRDYLGGDTFGPKALQIGGVDPALYLQHKCAPSDPTSPR